MNQIPKDKTYFIKHQEETRENLCALELGKVFLFMTSKPYSGKAKK